MSNENWNVTTPASVFEALRQQAARWTETENARRLKLYQDELRDWKLNRAQRGDAGKPTPPTAVRYDTVPVERWNEMVPGQQHVTRFETGVPLCEPYSDPVPPPVVAPGVVAQIGAQIEGTITWYRPGPRDNAPDGHTVYIPELLIRFKKRVVPTPFGYAQWYEREWIGTIEAPVRSTEPPAKADEGGGSPSTGN